MRCQDLNGKWLTLKDGDTYLVPDIPILEFMDDDKIIVYDFDKPWLNGHFHVSENVLKVNDEIWGKISFVDRDRLRLSMKGTTNGKDTVHHTEYARLLPTAMELEKEEIEKLSYRFKWNDEEGIISFNKEPSDIDDDLAFFLENIESVLFVSIYIKGVRETVLPIRRATLKGLELYGLPDKPYVVFAPTNK